MESETKQDAENKKVATAEELTRALAWNGGIQNSSVHHVKIDREKTQLLIKTLEASAAAAMQYFSRPNDIFFHCIKKNSDLDISNPQPWDKVTFEVTVWTHSGIGEGVRFKCDIGGGTFEVVGGGTSKLHGANSDGSGDQDDDDGDDEDNEEICGDDKSNDDDGIVTSILDLCEACTCEDKGVLQWLVIFWSAIQMI